ncbi:MAG: TetR/AcrR family transcriptional regulator [Woeseia sp.]
MTRHAQASKTEARSRAQRERILAAAHACFVERGFHAASMANIAETAGMSAGLIYRYFESKDAIILAIIERQLEDSRADIAKLRSDTNFVSCFSDLFTRWQSNDAQPMNPALMLEMTAEASRNPEIAGALATSDRITGGDFNGWLAQAARKEGREPAGDEITARAFALRCFLGGLAVRSIRDPDIDPSVLRQALELVLPQLLSFKS